MSSRNGRLCAALGGLVLATAAAAQQQPSPTKDRQGAAAEASGGGKTAVQPGPSAYETQSLAISRDANRISSLSAAATIRQADYSLSQVVLGGFATFFTALAAIAAIAAAYFAKHAAEAARESAKADNEALAETRAAGEEGRKEAVRQAKRAKEQLELMDQTMQFTAKSAYAMDHSATATRGLASATRNATQLAAETASKQLRPYVYILSERVNVGQLTGTIYADHAPITFSLQNFGQTPAKHVRLRARAFIGGYWSEPFDSHFESATVISRADMPPAFVREIDGFGVDGISHHWAAILMHEKSIFLDGLIEYEDGTGKQYVTPFRRACTGDNLNPGVFFITDEGNDAT